MWDGLVAALGRWRERWKSWRNKKTPLREFIYLDETSVYSLYASRIGAIKSEYTDTLTRVRQDEVGGSINSPAGAAKSGLTARAITAQSQQSQVVSRAIVQSTFKELLEKERDSLSLKHVPGFERTPRIESLNGLRAKNQSKSKLKKLRKKGFVVDPNTLVRGALLEIEVELNPEVIFQFSSVMQALVGMVRKNPALFGREEGEIAEVDSISSIIEELLVGLIPLRGRAVDYSVVVLGPPDDKELIVHNRLLESLEDEGEFTIHPLFVVGVAEQSLFWKDIRRVLFAGQRFRLLCRVARDDIGKSWVPLKMQQVLSSMFPDLGEEIEKVNRGDLFKTEPRSAGATGAEPEHVVRRALQTHAARLAESEDISLLEDDVAEIDAIASRCVSAFESEQEKRAAFGLIENYIADRHNLEIDSNVALESRRHAREDANVSWSTTSELTSQSDTNFPDTSNTSEDEYFLDSEFIAIYW